MKRFKIKAAQSWKNIQYAIWELKNSISMPGCQLSTLKPVIILVKWPLAHNYLFAEVENSDLYDL